MNYSIIELSEEAKRIWIINKAKQIWPKISESKTKILITKYPVVIVPIPKEDFPDWNTIVEPEIFEFNRREIRLNKYENGIIGHYDPELDLLLIKQ